MSGEAMDPGAAVLAHVACADEAATDALGAALGAILQRGDLVCLRGDLGAGKTRMVRGIARGVGVDAAMVSSPTFVVVHEYPARADLPGSTGLVHVDAYRLRGADELDSLGWELVRGPGAPPLVVEWPERIEGALEDWGGPPSQPGGRGLRMDVAIAVEGPGSRLVEIRGPAAWRSRGGWSGVAALGIEAGGRPCPTCGRMVADGAATAPFCSDRCRMADLGKWLSGAYSVSREIAPEDAQEQG
jgi:tRNA threonylcarbamoyladenosine biosynthesis protein TsaE